MLVFLASPLRKRACGVETKWLLLFRLEIVKICTERVHSLHWFWDFKKVSWKLCKLKLLQTKTKNLPYTTSYMETTQWKHTSIWQHIWLEYLCVNNTFIKVSTYLILWKSNVYGLSEPSFCWEIVGYHQWLFEGLSVGSLESVQHSQILLTAFMSLFSCSFTFSVCTELPLLFTCILCR